MSPTENKVSIKPAGNHSECLSVRLVFDRRREESPIGSRCQSRRLTTVDGIQL